MNIVKFRDIYLESHDSGLTNQDIDNFNTNLRGKYAYVVNWKWVVPMSEMSEKEYIKASILDSSQGTDIPKDIIWYPVTDSSQDTDTPNNLIWFPVSDSSQDTDTMNNLIWFPVLDSSQDTDTMKPIGTDVPKNLIPFKAIELYKISDFVDYSETETVNDVSRYLKLNEFVSDNDITIDEAKKFRQYLAEQLLAIKYEFAKGEMQMLNYYKDNMYDSVVDSLTIFTENNQVQLSYIGKKSCDCLTTKNLQGQVVVNGQCDPINEYRKGVYIKMVELFSDYNYWIDLGGLCIDFKKYIDAIIKYNLPLFISSNINVFDDCTCASRTDSLQERGINAMKNLSSALQYIINSDVDGHKNFINEALSVFASQYYERMYWI